MSRVFVTHAVKSTGRLLRIENDATVLAVEYGKLVQDARARRSARLGREFTVADLARRASLPEWYVADLERGITKRTPSLEIMYRIARALKRHPAELLPVAGVIQ